MAHIDTRLAFDGSNKGLTKLTFGYRDARRATTATRRPLVGLDDGLGRNVWNILHAVEFT